MKITKRYICIISVQCAVRTKIKYLRNYLITSGSQSQSILQTYKQVIFFAFESIKKAIGIFVLPTAIRAVKSKLIYLICTFYYLLLFFGSTQPRCFATAWLNLIQTSSSLNSKCIVPFLKAFTRKNAQSNQTP